jgi:hypothetical protein
MRNRISSANLLFEDIQQEAVREKAKKAGYVNSNFKSITKYAEQPYTAAAKVVVVSEGKVELVIKWTTKIIARTCREKLESYGYTDDETFKFGTRNLKLDRELKVTSIVD